MCLAVDQNWDEMLCVAMASDVRECVYTSLPMIYYIFMIDYIKLFKLIFNNFGSKLNIIC